MKTLVVLISSIESMFMQVCEQISFSCFICNATNKWFYILT